MDINQDSWKADTLMLLSSSSLDKAKSIGTRVPAASSIPGVSRYSLSLCTAIATAATLAHFCVSALFEGAKLTLYCRGTADAVGGAILVP